MQLLSLLAIGLTVARVQAGVVKASKTPKAVVTTSATPSSHAGPILVSNTAEAISSVLASMSAMKPQPTISSEVTQKVTGSAFLTTVSSVSVSSSSEILSPKTGKATAKKATKTAVATKKAKAKKPKKATKKAATKKPAATKKATLHARAAVAAGSNCGVGSPVTSTLDCVNGWACSSANANSYICVSATPSSAMSTSTSSSPKSTLVTSTISRSSISTLPSCTPEAGTGFSYKPATDSMAGFLQDATLSGSALAAQAPSGYSWEYAGFFGSLNQAGYMTYASVSSYNQSYCASLCDGITGCQGFDIYFERNPTLTPAASCPDPSSQTTVRCAFYSQYVNATFATNFGEWRNQFGVVVAGGNGYNKIPATKSVFSTSTSKSSSQMSTTALPTSSPASSSVTTSSTTSAITSHFTILSAFLADSDITKLAQTNFVVGSQLIVNTTYPSNALGSDPWVGNNNKFISILYQYKNETRVFAAIENTGVYTQQDAYFAASSAPGSTLTPGYVAPSGSSISIQAIVFGTSQYTAQSLYNTLYADQKSSSSFQFSDAFFGFDPNWGTTKSGIIWYKNASGVLTSLAAREDATVSF